jgi:hypothetical protein
MAALARGWRDFEAFESLESAKSLNVLTPDGTASSEVKP